MAGARSPRRAGQLDGPGDTALGGSVALVTAIAGGDPSVEELVAFRRQPIDLKAAARHAKSLSNEEFRLSLARGWGTTRASSPAPACRS